MDGVFGTGSRLIGNDCTNHHLRNLEDRQDLGKGEKDANGGKGVVRVHETVHKTVHRGVDHVDVGVSGHMRTPREQQHCDVVIPVEQNDGLFAERQKHCVHKLEEFGPQHHLQRPGSIVILAVVSIHADRL